MKDIEQTLRKAAQDSGLSMAELNRRAGLPYATTHGFVRTGRMITLRSAAALAGALGLELRPVKRRTSKRKGPTI